VLGSPRRRYGTSRNKSSSEGFIGGRLFDKIEGLDWRLAVGGVDPNPGNGGRSDGRREGMECIPI